MIALEFTKAEVATIARLTGNLLTGNLMASVFEAELDPGVLESIYYKTSQCFMDEEENSHNPSTFLFDKVDL